MLKLKGAALAVALALSLTGCGQETSSTSTQTPASTAQQQLHSGLTLQDFDRSVRPQDDLFMFVNGTWYNTVEIPSDRPRFGAMDVLSQENERRLRSIIETAVAQGAAFGSNNQKIADYYTSYMNEAEIEALGITPVEPFLAQIKAVTNHAELTQLMGQMVHHGVSIPFGFYAYADAKNPDYNTVYFSQSGLGLPDRDYYFRDLEAFENIRQAYVGYSAAMLTAIGHPRAQQAAENIYALEKALAEHHWTRAESRDAEATYNKMTVAQLQELLAEFNYAEFAQQAGLTAATEVVVRMPSYLTGFAELFKQTDVETWKDYMQLRLMSAVASRLSSEVADIQFDFYSKTLSGVPEQQERWKRAVQATNRALGEVLGQEYVAQYFPPEAKARMEELIEHLLVAFNSSIQELDWMTPETKAKALDKLSRFTAKIGYPNQWRDYSALEIVPNNLFENSLRVSHFNYQQNLADIGQPVDRERWGMTPQTVNAYYNPTGNEIVFPAGILQPPYFNMDAEDAVNYGGIGAVIGHEIGHGFDDQGSRYDGHGNLRNWWTDEDRGQFEQRTAKLIAQYNQFEPLPGLHVDGQVSLGENIGDHVGLISAYRAYQNSLAGKDSPVLDGFTGEQRLFLSWAQIWKIKFRDDAMREQLARGPHAPGQYRALGAPRNIPGFYEAFAIQPGDGMYVAPEQRVVLW